MADRETFRGRGELRRVDGSPVPGGPREYEITVTRHWVRAGDERVEGPSSVSGYIALQKAEEALKGEFVLTLEDGRSLPFYFQDFRGLRGYIAASGSLK